MILQVVGCNHRTASIAVRERLAFSPQQSRAFLARWKDEYDLLEAVLLSTCNRVELYTATDLPQGPSPEEMISFLTGFHRVPVESLEGGIYHWVGREAVEHLFSVCSSLDSMVLGESQIASQVKQAYQIAVQEGTVGPILHAAFQAAAKTAKRVATETAIQLRKTSIPSVAIGDFARAVFERFDDKKTLVIGAGEMAEETLRYLREEGAQTITVVNRSQDRAEQLAGRWQGRAESWQELPRLLADADLVISTTGAEQPIVSKTMLQSAVAARPERPLFVLDLAVPRDFEPSAAQLSGVYLYCLDDLKKACERNREFRDREIPAAVRIVEQEVEDLLIRLHGREAGPVIRGIRRDWEKIKRDELQRLWNKLPDLPESTRGEIEETVDRILNKLLHRPLRRLQEEFRRGTSHTLLDALRGLFHLPPE
ncbi:MAG: glutamyl-tRNA reductase [Thermogutta sp.]